MIRSDRERSAPAVRIVRDGDHDAWEKYVLTHPSGTVFHRLQWSKAVARVYGHRPYHLTAWENNRLIGVLPMFLVKSVFVHRVLISVPYATYGGILADSPRIAATLLDFAKRLCGELSVRYLELRHRDPSGLDLPEMGRYDTFRKPLPPRPEDVLHHLPRKARAAARAGLRDLGEDCTTISPDLLDTVYDLYACTLRRLGSPNYKRKLFHALQDEYGADCVSLVVWNHGRAVAGVVSFIFRDEIIPYFSGSLPQGMATNANNVMYLRLMEYAAGRKLRWFDFNRTRRDNRGPYDFKRHHGFEPAPLHYQVLLGRADKMPDLTPSNRKFVLAGRMWRRIPLWLTRTAGARITKWIP